MPPRRWLVVTAVLLVTASARGDLGIQLGVGATIGATVAVTVTATNTGDEPAHALVPEVQFQDVRVRGDAETNLDVGQAHTWALTLPPPAGPGTYPLRVQLAYADGHGQPASARAVRLASTPGMLGTAIEARLHVEPIGAHGTAVLSLSNPTMVPIAGRVVPMLPAMFTTPADALPAEVPARGHADVTFPVENVGATVGSTFPLYALFEYDQRGLHQTVLGEASLVVVPSRPPGANGSMVIGGLALLVAVALLGLVLVRARRGGASGGT